jgi:hypothetical protein
VQPSPILGAVLATLRKDLDTTAFEVVLVDMDVDLAVFAIHFLLDTHVAVSHIQAILNAAAFPPVGATNLNSQGWLQGLASPAFPF